MALGAIAFNDENGFHAQRGFLGTYAYHLNLGRSDAMNQLSFGLSLMYSQNSVDQSSFNPQIPDPSISGINESSGYFNADVSFGYHYMDGFSYLTVKNVFLTERGLVDNQFETNNLRRYLFTLGYYWGREKSFQLEPSLMFQLVEYTGEFLTDINLKAYKDVSSKTTLWAALSYRMNFEGDSPESFKQITPIVGLNYKRLMISYTYSSQLGDLTYDQGGHHQFTIGFDVLCTPPRATGCPNLNTRY
jgi:type IX secretion system PorP/SprF family membrane protein